MSTLVDPTLAKEIAQYGPADLNRCIHCGNCTAVCKLSGNNGEVFPRKTIRYLQLGLKDRLLGSTEPWTCYYCGECSDTCPQQTYPGEIMMTMRRWLTAQYDHSGQAAKVYTSQKTVWTTIVKASIIPLALLAAFHIVTGFRHIVTDRVVLNAFAPVYWVWAAVLIHFAMLGWRVFANATHMARNVLRVQANGIQLRMSHFVKELGALAVHFITQKRWRDCGPQHHRDWATHALLVSGYVTILILVVGMLGWFQTDRIYAWYHPQRWLGYYATVVLVYGSVIMLLARIRKRDARSTFSQHTDWLFPAFILVGAVTGILVHGFRYAGWPWLTYGMYTFHLMAMMAMLDSEVGIGKWSHMIYRPLAIYLGNVILRAKQSPAGSVDA